MPPVVTISASYGAYGDKLGRALAERLTLPFLDRAIPADAAHQLAQAPDMAESHEDRVPTLWERIATGFANGSTPMGPGTVSPEVIETPERFRAANEELLRQLADSTGAVILGRAGMAVFADRPDVLRIRLDGPVEARIAQAVSQGIEVESARRSQREVDKARDAYARVFFNVRQDDPRLYHLILDSTALSFEACLDISVRAARDRFGATTP
jgi:cytidylate kinase